MKAPHRDESVERDRSAALDWVVASGSVNAVFGEVEAQLRRRRRRRLVTGGVITAAVLGAATFSWQFQREAGAALPLDVPIAATQRQVLPDGSTIELKAGGDIVVQFGEASRRVELRQGRAHFFVAKDPLRPFVVTANGVEVRAVGTAFVVDRRARAVRVEVTEGRVMVEQLGGSPTVTAALSTLVDAGSQVLLDLEPLSPTQTTALVNSGPATSAPAPRPPRIVLSGTTLAQAITLFNQHADERLVIGDGALKTLELSGVIRADNTSALLQLLADQFGIRAERQGNDVVLHR